MTRKFTTARRDAFLRALAATGNQTLAAERAKVSRSWVHLHQSTDPAFRQAMDAAIAQAKAALDDAAARRPDDPAQRWQDGAELVVRGSRGRRTQIARSRVKQWSPRVEQRFLRALASCCNVKAACAEVGMTAASAYGHRHRWAEFAQRWDAAIETGYARIEGALIEKASNLFSETELTQDLEITGMTVDHAIHLLHMHKRAVKGIGERPGQQHSRRIDMEKVRASIRRKIEAIARHEERERARDAAGLKPGQGEPARWPGERQGQACVAPLVDQGGGAGAGRVVALE